VDDPKSIWEPHGEGDEHSQNPNIHFLQGFKMLILDEVLVLPPSTLCMWLTLKSYLYSGWTCGRDKDQRDLESEQSYQPRVQQDVTRARVRSMEENKMNWC
jgi:hypothetical protein